MFVAFSVVHAERQNVPTVLPNHAQAHESDILLNSVLEAYRTLIPSAALEANAENRWHIRSIMKVQDDLYRHPSMHGVLLGYNDETGKSLYLARR